MSKVKLHESLNFSDNWPNLLNLLLKLSSLTSEYFHWEVDLQRALWDTVRLHIHQPFLRPTILSVLFQEF